MLGRYLKNVRETAPLIHNITNYVTVNDCANILLACGALPVMADDQAEAEAITAICGGLTINIGTLNSRTIVSMLLAGKKAAQLGHPIVLDPVGAGASPLRTHTADELISQLPLAAVRGNISEIKALSGSSSLTHGVDANASDKVTDDNLWQHFTFARKLAKAWNTVIAISGETDIVADENKAFAIKNGSALMSKITGSGCMLSALTTAYVTAAKKTETSMLEAVAAAFCTMGIAGENAADRMGSLDGSASFRNYLLDAVFNMTEEELDTKAKYELVSYTDD
ncbi:hydroxyethylthiazole kinase [Pectinatus haikarae]|uniref:Hydroxyethylthiazole kinase n=1 Tax=Pectinatus haikarae TaxID=349096 RepID=A0ABT9Y421_9FIRM|nr:hydroxyethylthiazole kinase [Pectinatus haikarae]MDQ0202577.1 hydroxyethylthiazole kinase [Pectinatus haikarae]